MSNPIFTSLEMESRATKNAANKAGKNEPFPFPSRPGFRRTIDFLDFMVCFSNKDHYGSSRVCVYKSHHDEDEDYLFVIPMEKNETDAEVLQTAKLAFKHYASIREHPGSQSNQIFELD